VEVRTQYVVAGMARRVGQGAKQWVLSVQDYIMLSWRGLKALFTRPVYAREIVNQMDHLGVESLPIVVLTGMFTGMVLSLQSAASLDAFGPGPTSDAWWPSRWSASWGPVLTALMVTGRVGSGMAAELGSDGGDPADRRPARPGQRPRAQAGGPAPGRGHHHGPDPDHHLRHAGDLRGQPDQHLQPAALLGLLLAVGGQRADHERPGHGPHQAVVFGFILASVGCHMGLQTTGGTQGVGLSTTRSVVLASVLILSSDFFMTKILLILFPVT
jgi:phospholipid/cholesterol/gamma-HCH transport system permease protein